MTGGILLFIVAVIGFFIVCDLFRVEDDENDE
jgi:hypothetical protein